MIHKPTIITLGFGAEPHGIIHVLNTIAYTKPVTIYLTDPLTNISELPYAEIAKIEDKTSVFVVIFSAEGHAYREFKQIIDRLVNESGMIPKNICIHSTALVDADDSPVHLIGTISNLIGHMVHYVDLNPERNFNFVQKPTHHYVCLNRLHRWERAALVEELFDRSLAMYGKISYATGTKDEVNIEKVKLVFKPKYRNLLPLVLDKPDVDYEGGFKMDNSYIKGALFNIVTESAYEHPASLNDPYNRNINVQHCAGITEKTFKVFIMGQIPIMLAPRGTVEACRRLGFDMYDDIVNHDYDNEPDPRLRISRVVDEVERLCLKYTIDDLAALKSMLDLRQQRNVEIMMKWKYNNSILIPDWVKYFKAQGACSV